MAVHTGAHVPRWHYPDGGNAVTATRRVCNLCGCHQVKDARTGKWR